MSFLYNNWVLLPLFFVCVFVVVYFQGSKLIDRVYSKTLSNRAEIMRMFKLMYIEVSEKKLTLLLLFCSFGLGFLVFLLTWPNLIAGFLFGTFITVLGWLAPMAFVKMMWERRANLFVEQMVDGLTLMANGIKSGTNAMQAMQRVVEIMGNPIAQEFQTIITANQFGQSFEEALLDLGERIPRPDVQMFVISINILKETGGNLAETFETIVSVVRERQKIEKKIEAMTAQGMMQGMIVSMIPFVLAGVFFVIDPKFIMPMFTTTLGWILCLVILILQIIGGIMIKKIVTIKV